MSTRVGASDIGIRGGAPHQIGDVKRAALVLSDGSVVVIVSDENDASASGGDQTGVPKFRLFHSTDRVTWTLEASFSTPNKHNTAGWTAAVFPDNSVAVVWSNESGGDYDLRYVKFTYSAGPTWTAGSGETIASSSLSRYQTVDMTITDTAVPVVVGMKRDTTGMSVAASFHGYTRRTSDNTWIFSHNVSLGGSNFRDVMDCSIVSLGGTASARRLVYAFTHLDYATGSGADNGFLIYTALVNETTGVGSGDTLRSTLFAGTLTVDLTKTYAQTPRRIYLWRSSTDGWTAGIISITNMNTSTNKSTSAVRGTWDGTTYTVSNTPSLVSRADSAGGSQGSIVFGNGRIVFLIPMASYNDIRHWISKFSVGDITVSTSGPYYWDGSSTDTADYAPVGNDQSGVFTSGKFDTINVREQASGDWHIRHHYAVAPAVPTSVRPVASSTVNTSTPTVGGVLVQNTFPNNQPIPAMLKMIWELATNSGFTTNVRTQEQMDGSFTLDTGSLIQEALTPANSLTQTTWYVRAAQIDEFDNQGAWSAGHSFVVSHPPVATPIAPDASAVTEFGTGVITFSWSVSDPYAGDSQTAYQIIVKRVSDGATALDTGKVTETANFDDLTISGTYKGVDLTWKIRVWDEDDVAGPYSAEFAFLLKDKPTVVIDEPDANDVVASALVDVTFTPTSGGGGGAMSHFRILVTQAGVTIHDTGWIRYTISSGATFNYVGAEIVFDNDSGYTYIVQVRENWELEGSASVAFSTHWTPPAGPAGLALDGSQYNVEGAGYIEISWDDTARDDDYIGWNVYRKDDEVDRLGNVIEEGEYQLIGTVTETEALYEYFDYFAPASKNLSYRVQQVVTRFGDVVESESVTTLETNQPAEGYWIVEPTETNESNSFRLSNVTGDSYSDDYEEAEYVILGRGRRVDRGERLGVKGALSAQLRDNIHSTARQKKRALENIKDENRVLFLRTPFGDVYRVSVGNLGVGRIAGVGDHEAVDVSIPYTEVGE